VVVSNSEGQHCLWPTFLAVPAGWSSRFGPAARSACLDYVSAEWTDIRPISLLDRLGVTGDQPAGAGARSQS
jgi:MbtH protein